MCFSVGWKTKTQYVMYSLILHDNGFLKDGPISIVQGKQCIWKHVLACTEGIIKPPDIWFNVSAAF